MRISKTLALFFVSLLFLLLVACKPIEPVSVAGAEINESNELILELSNGEELNLGVVVGEDGLQGVQGLEGIGIESIIINDKGELIITMTDEDTINLGVVIGNKGEPGEDGLSSYEIYKKYYPNYPGTEKEWIVDLSSGNLALITGIELNGGQFPEDYQFPNIIMKGDSFGDIPTPTKDEHTFVGWFTDPLLEKAFNTDSIILSSTTLYACWDAFVEVEVSYNLDGGNWKNDVISQFTPENTITGLTRKDAGGTTITVIDSTATGYHWFYKLFIKYDIGINAYTIVAIDNATDSIENLIVPEYDYVVLAHSSADDKQALQIIKDYTITNESINKIIVFENENMKELKIYPVGIENQAFIHDLYNITMLPVPYKEGHKLSGWKYGNEIFTSFPRYTESSNITEIIYIAVWEELAPGDVDNYLLSIIPVNLNKNIELPNEYLDYTIEWTSSNIDIISNAGIYKRPYRDTYVTLTALISGGDNKVFESNYTVNVIGYKAITSNIASSYIYTGYNTLNDTFFNSLDIINTAFTIADADGNLTGTTYFNNVKNFIMPKAKTTGTWVVMSVAPESKWSTIAANPILVETFANNIVNAINTYGFDGVDIDWETPTSAQATSYTALMKVVYEKVKANNPNHLVTTAITAGKWQIANYDILNSLKYIDFVNVMAYGLTNNTGYYQNPLYKSSVYHNTTFNVGKALGSTSIDETVKLFKNTYNIPYNKMIIGLAFYGVKQTRTSSSSAWTSAGSVVYHTIVSNYINNPNYTDYFDDVSKVPYIIKNDGTEFISYDNYESTLLKSQYVRANNLAGIMYWQNGGDNTGTLLSAIYKGLKE